ATRFASSIPSNGRVYAITTLGYPTTRPVFGWRRIKGLLGSFGLDESVGDVAGSVAASPNFNSNVALRSTNIFDDTRRLEGFGDTEASKPIPCGALNFSRFAVSVNDVVARPPIWML